MLSPTYDCQYMFLLLFVVDGGIPRELADIFPIVLINTDLSTNLPIWFTVSLCAEGCPFSLRICFLHDC